MCNMDLTVIQNILENSVGLAAMLILIYWQRCDAKDKDKCDAQNHADQRNDKLLLLTVVKENTQAITNITGVCNSIKTSIERLSYGQVN